MKNQPPRPNINLPLLLLLSCIALFTHAQHKTPTEKSPTPESLRSPENQVFQFMQSGNCTAWPDSSKTNSTLYLWIPEKCKQVRGLLIMCTNVPEHMLVGHPSIRKACEENNLGIIWATPTFMNFRKITTKDNKQLNMATQRKVTVDFLQSMLNGLADSSGYKEIATVPWLPMGESGHLLMVDALMENSPERCMAGIFIKNNHLPPQNRQVPTLTAYGSAQEWSQDKSDIRTKWNDVAGAYEMVRNQRRLNPSWPFSYVIDGTSGHFDCSERLANYFAHYIDLVAKARLSDDGSPTLKPVALEKGFSAEMPIPGYGNKPIRPFTKDDTSYLPAPWYFDMASAIESQSIASINWKASTQLPGYLTDSGKIAPFIFNGISRYTPSDMGKDGITFHVKGIMLQTIPENFVAAGEKLPHAPYEPVLEWVSGQYKPLGNGYFQISLDRSYPNTANYLGVRQKGNDSLRAIFQPCGLILPKNNIGKPQKITFDPIPDVEQGIKSINLKSTSDAGLPVKFYVVAGPAIIEGNKLVFTKIPPKSQFPLKVTVAAWQWGRNTEPKIKMADIVKQSFYILGK